jgi:DNA-binding MarR family transcriptional regulator
MEIQGILGYMLNVCARLIKREMDSHLESYNITTAQWAVLKLLDTKEQLTQTEIASELSGDKATAGEVIFRLCEKKYLEKKQDTRDRRAYVVTLTPKAKDMVKDIEKMADEVTEKALKDLNNEDMQVLYKSLNKIIINLSGEEKP